MPHWPPHVQGRGATALHRLPAGLKLALLLAITIAIVQTPASLAWAVAAAIGALLLTALLARIPFRFLAWRLLLLEPMIVSVAAMNLLRPGGGPVFLAAVLRGSACLLAALLFAATTPFGDLLHVLRRLRVPGLLVTTLALMYRYLFLLVEESRRMNRARASRTFVARRRLAWTGLATVAARLFVRASDRAERIHAAMCARGWT